MKRLAYALFAAVVLIAVPAVAGNNALDGPRAFGIGVGGNGWTSGLSGKLFLGGNTALQAIVGNCGWGWYYDERGYYRSADTLCAGADLIFEESGVGRGPLALPVPFPLLGPDGGLTAFGAISEDITERRRLVAELDHARVRAEEVVDDESGRPQQCPPLCCRLRITRTRLGATNCSAWGVRC